MRKHQATRTQQSIARRHGLSLLEILSCIAALAGGVWLGALYLGVDVHTLVRGALVEAKILPPSDELSDIGLDTHRRNVDASPRAPDVSSPGRVEDTAVHGEEDGQELDGTEANASPSRQVLPPAADGDSDPDSVELLKQELATLRNAVTRLQAGEPAELPPSVSESLPRGTLPPGSKPSLGSKLTQKLTRAQQEAVTRRTERTFDYWENLLATVQEARTTAPELLSLTLAAEIERRKSVYRRAARTIRTLNTKDVDAEAVAFGQKLSQWYYAGVELLQQAEYQLYRASMQQFRTAPGAAWGTTERQHLKEAELLVRLSKEAAAHLSQNYGRDFPSL